MKYYSRVLSVALIALSAVSLFAGGDRLRVIPPRKAIEIRLDNAFLPAHTFGDNAARIGAAGLQATPDGVGAAIKAAIRLAKHQPHFCIPYVYINKTDRKILNLAVPVYHSMINDVRRTYPKRNGEMPALFMVGNLEPQGRAAVVFPRTFLETQWVLNNDEERSAALDQHAGLIVAGNHNALIIYANAFGAEDSSSSDDSSGSESEDGTRS